MSNSFDENLILYVRGYTKSQDAAHKDTVFGVDKEGNYAEVRLRPMDDLKEKHQANRKVVIPEIDTIAKGDPKKSGCIAGVNNGTENRTGGVLLLDGARKEFSAEGKTTYTATWPHVLAHSAGGADPIYDVPGYIQRVPFFTTDSSSKENAANHRRVLQIQTELESRKIQIHQAIANGNTSARDMHNDRIRLLSIEFDELVNIRHRAVLIHANGGNKYNLEYRLATAEKLENRLSSIIDQQSVNGCHGGVMVRALTLGGEIINNASGQIHTRWDPKLSMPGMPYGAVTSPITEVRRFLESPRGASLLNLHKQGATLQLVPLTFMNFAPSSNKKWNRPEQSDIIHELYKDPHTHNNVARNIAVRSIHPKEDMNTLLVSEVFPAGPAIGSPLQVGPQGSVLPFSHDKQPVPRGKPSLTQGMEYVITVPGGDRAIVECKNGTNGIGLYSGNIRINEYNMVGPAPNSKPSF